MTLMKTTHRNFLVTAAVIIILAAGILYAKKAAAPAPGAAGSATTTTLALPGGGSIAVSGNGAVIKEVDTTISVPSYSKPLVFSSSTTSDVQSALTAQFEALQSIFKSKPTDYEAWLQLGIIRKIGGDYAGAAADWTYVGELYPKSPVPHDDLGDLYLNFTKEYAKAEGEYKQAIALNPQDANAYRALFSLYADFGYKTGTTAAVDIMKQAIANNPKAIDLYVLLAQYYAKTGDTANARAEYSAAIAQAQAQNNPDLAAELGAEQAALK